MESSLIAMTLWSGGEAVHAKFWAGYTGSSLLRTFSMLSGTLIQQPRPFTRTRCKSTASKPWKATGRQRNFVPVEVLRKSMQSILSILPRHEAIKVPENIFLSHWTYLEVLIRAIRWIHCSGDLRSNYKRRRILSVRSWAGAVF